jgi:Acetyltransferases
MSIRIETGSLAYLDDCEEALRDSELGKVYFEKEGSAKNAVLEGLNSPSFYVALEKDQCVGFMYYIPEGAFHSFPYLHLIAVKAECRGKGVGKEMLEFLEDMVFKTRDKIFLVVADFNPDGKRFYEKMGYRQVGVIPDLYRKGVNEYLMMKVYRPEP